MESSHSRGPRAVFLGSGSAGNCTAIVHDGTVVLVDCGFSARETARRLTEAGLKPAEVSAILVTHEHGDHVRGIDVFVRRHAPDCAVYASGGTLAAARNAVSAGATHRVRAGESFGVGSLDIVAFRTSHDATEPVGYRVSAEGCSIGIATDTGVLTPEAEEALTGVTTLAIECNHDPDMLERGPYPYHLKRRIFSEAGHLSNADAAAALSRLAHDRLERVVSLHRSRTNNTARLAGRALANELRRLGLEIDTEVIEQDGSTGLTR